jgi:hypothetical protein
VKFKGAGTRTYTYEAQGAIEELEQYTHAVVMSPSDGLVVVTIVKVDTVDDSTYDGEYKQAVCVFDMNQHDAAVSRASRKAAIEKELRRRIAERSKEENYEKLLGNDENAMKLLEEYKSL